MPIDLTRRRTKSESAALVAAGQVTEMFHHSQFGIFNISAARELVRLNPDLFPVYTVLFRDIRVEGKRLKDKAAIRWLIGQREVDKDRVAELTEDQINDPVMHMTDGPHSYLADGIHRLVARHARGRPDFQTVQIPILLMPRLVPPAQGSSLYLDVPWGNKDVVDGKLVDAPQEGETK